MMSDTLRYSALYNTDCYNTTNFDVVLDTTNLSISEVVESVLSHARNTFK